MTFLLFTHYAVIALASWHEKKIDKTKEYAVNRIGHCVGGDVEKAREMVARAGKLRSDIWNKYGSLSMLGNVSSKTLSRLSENQSSR